MTHYEYMGFGGGSTGWFVADTWDVKDENDSWAGQAFNLDACPNLRLGPSEPAITEGKKTTAWGAPIGWTVKQLTRTVGMTLEIKSVWVSPAGVEHDLSQCSPLNISRSEIGKKKPELRLGPKVIDVKLPAGIIGALVLGGLAYYIYTKRKG